MCGLVGWYRPNRQVRADVLRRQSDLLAHRGPDDSGMYIDQQAGFAVAHRRLAIVGLGVEGSQPMHSVSGRYVLAFTGEIYNHLELRGRLHQEVNGLQFRGGSDTETLLACIEYWGFEMTLREADGMFAIVLWDREQRCLLLARDRLGEKPLYLGWLDGQFVFASELKPLLRTYPVRMDAEAAAAMLVFGYVPGPRSILESVYKLPPATWLEVDEALARNLLRDPIALQARVQRYWNLDAAAATDHRQLLDSDLDCLEDAEQVLGRAVRSRMMSEVPIGACLSGGIDSSLITALIQRHTNLPLQTYTIGFAESSFDEAPYAERIAEYLGVEHQTIRLNAKEALALIPNLPEIYDEPFADSSQLPTLLLARVLREHVTVALSGDGGDELFHGYQRYGVARRLWRFYGMLPRIVRSMQARLFEDQFDRRYRLWRFSQRAQASHFDSYYLSHLATMAGAHLFFETEAGVQRFVEPLSNDPQDEDERMMLRDQQLYLPDDILVKVDRASMAVGLEMRPPLLAREVVEWAWRLPLDCKRRHGKGKWVLRQVLARYLPGHMFERPKMGFGVPLDEWLRGPLCGWADGLLSHGTLKQLVGFRAHDIDRLWQAHRSGRVDAGYSLWNLLVLVQWRLYWGL